MTVEERSDLAGVGTVFPVSSCSLTTAVAWEGQRRSDPGVASVACRGQPGGAQDQADQGRPGSDGRGTPD